MDDLRINDAITIPDSELEERFVRSSGPGGQNVNKVSTKVELRFDVAGSTVLPADAKERLLRLAGQRATQEGILILEAQSERSRERNREIARERLTELVLQSLQRPKPRMATKPTRSSQTKRLDQKSKRSKVKQKRGPVRSGDE